MAHSFHSIGERQKLPATGNVGDVFLWKGETYLAIGDGSLVKTSQLLTAITALGLSRLVGPQGEPGRDGADSVVPGPKGDKGDKGDRGEQGPPGDITIVGPVELKAAVAKLKAQKAAGIAKIMEVLSRRPDSPSAARAHLHLKAVLNELNK